MLAITHVLMAIEAILFISLMVIVGLLCLLLLLTSGNGRVE